MNSTELLQYIHKIEASFYKMYDHIAWYAVLGFMTAVMAICLIFYLGWHIDRLTKRIKDLEKTITPKMVMDQKQFNDVNSISEEGG